MKNWIELNYLELHLPTPVDSVFQVCLRKKQPEKWETRTQQCSTMNRKRLQSLAIRQDLIIPSGILVSSVKEYNHHQKSPDFFRLPNLNNFISTYSELFGISSAWYFDYKSQYNQVVRIFPAIHRKNGGDALRKGICTGKSGLSFCIMSQSFLRSFLVNKLAQDKISRQVIQVYQF